MTANRVQRLSRSLAIFVPLLCALLTPAGAVGQEPIVPLRLSFSDPGARSMGFGGAFVALADDATAAFANPAGLVQLAKPEVSMEGRHWDYSTSYAKGGRVEGQPSGFGIDTRVGLETARSENTITGLSFLSVAHPLGKGSLAFFRHELANFAFSGETQGFFGGGTNCCQNRFFDQRMATDVNFVSYGLSGAYRITERLAVGLGAIYHETSLTSTAEVFLPDEDPELGLLAPTSYFAERSYLSQHLFADDTDWSFTGGFLLRLSNSWRIGGVYRQGLEAGVTVETTAGQANDLGVSPGTLVNRITGIPVQFPWVLGLGFAYRAPDGGLTVTFQWDHFQYSTIVESPGLEDVTVDDTDELHLGAEHVFLRTTPVVAVRAGAWFDPDHQVRSTGDDPFARALQPRGDNEMHYSAGLGVALQNLQVDVAVDFADPVNTVSLSAIFGF
ncbi:MAG: outer membrane protein transport protein [Acidobacteriota bacterium]|nr:outer membrane protein transport protein [Acidobacteriota bacterium]